jgi:hypothetical protein
MLPLRKIPPAFVLTLAPLAQFWGAGRELPLPEDVVLNSADLQACEQMAAAVLAAKRGAETESMRFGRLMVKSPARLQGFRSHTG